jgi:hypothetical protein
VGDAQQSYTVVLNVLQATRRNPVAATPPREEIEMPVEKQFEAYNARDIDAFMEWWAADCKYYEFPDRLLANGAAEIRERHVARFREPNLFGQLLNRIVVDNLVVDQETVRRTFAEGPGEVDVLAIYEVSAGKITRAWFKLGSPRMIGTRS